MVRVLGRSGGAIYTRKIPPSWAEWVGFGPVRQQQSSGPVFTKTEITQPTELQMMCRQLHMKVHFTIFPSMYNTWVGTIEIGTEFTMNLEVKI